MSAIRCRTFHCLIIVLIPGLYATANSARGISGAVGTGVA